MILKIRSMFPEAVESWRFIEDVQGLHYTRYSSLADEPITSDLASGTQELCFLHPMEMPGNSSGGAVVAYFTTGAMGPVRVCCTTEMYLMNDSGKTIEKLL